MDAIDLSQDQKLEIAQMAAQILVSQLQVIQQAHMEILGAGKSFFDAHPELRGRHKELGEIVTRLEKSNPNLNMEQLFALAAKELNRNAD